MRSGIQLTTVAALTMALALVPAPPDSPVADAARAGDTATVRALLREGADVNAAQGDGMTALHWAALNDDVATMEVLLYAGAALEPRTRLGGYTPLHLAAREGLADATRALLEAGCGPGTVTSTGVGAIHLVAQAGNPEALRALLDHGADVNARDSHGDRTPLIYATARNRLAAIDVLLDAGADITMATAIVDYPERAAVDLADRQRRARLVAAAREPSEDDPPAGSGEPRQAAAALATPGAPDPAASQAPPETADPDRPTPDPPAEPPAAPPEEPESADPDRPTTPSSEAPVGRGGEPEAPAGEPPAAPEPQPLSYTDLVGRQGGMTALHYAARDGHAEAALRFLDAGANVDHRTGGDASTPLLVAVINGNFDLAMELLERGADPDLVSEDGVGPLFAVLNNEWALRTWYPQPTAAKQQETSYLELMEALLEAGADPNARVDTHVWYAAYNAGRMGVDFSGATPLWRAAYATDVAAMRLLVAYGADPNIATKKPPRGRRRGRPGNGPEDDPEEDPSGLPPVPVGGPAVHPLHAASGVGYGTSRVGQQHRHVPDGWLPAVRFLVEEVGVDVNVRDHDGYTALHNAAARGDNEVIEFLIDHGADVMVVSRRGQTTVDMANGPQQRVQPFFETIALLESHGAVNNDNCQSC